MTDQPSGGGDVSVAEPTSIEEAIDQAFDTPDEAPSPEL